MDLDKLSKILQEWTNKIPLVVLGSGASIPLFLPSMWELGEFLKKEIAFKDHLDAQQFDSFKSYLEEYEDLETALTKINELRPAVLDEIISKTWMHINRQDLLAYHLILHHKTPFPLKDLVKYFLATSDKKLSIVTTNYDRLAEYAASLAKATINTGYLQNYIGAFAPGTNGLNSIKVSGYSGQVNIWKVHGSLDWFKSEDGQLFHLPLQVNIPQGFLPSIVTPGTVKYYETHKDPFRSIFSEADNAIQNANGFLCIGYGFNDEHVQPYLIDQVKLGKPIILITKQLTDAAKKNIIENGCKNYILIEQDKNSANTKVHSSLFGELIIKNSSYWILTEYLTLIK